MVFSSDLLDSLTQNYFSGNGNVEDQPLHVEDIKVVILPSIFQQLTIHCSRFKHSLIDLAMREPHPVCGSKEKNIVQRSSRLPGEITIRRPRARGKEDNRFPTVNKSMQEMMERN